MQSRRLGAQGPIVSAIGLGCMGMSDFYGRTDRHNSIKTIHAAMDAGITLFDTGDFYGCGDNEMLIAEALADRRDRAFIQVKFGVLRDPSGGFIGLDLRPEAIKNALAYTLRRLRTDYVDLYQPARIGPQVPLEDVIGTLADLKAAGFIRHIGLSEGGAETLRRAHAIHPVTALQIEYSLMSRGAEADILTALRDNGIGLTAYGVLSRGLLSGRVSAAGYSGKPDFRASAPRFQDENLARNLALVAALKEVAAGYCATPAQAAIAWALSRGDDIVPLVGARRPEQLAEALGALELTLSAADLARFEAAVPAEAVAGERYDARGMTMLDSERR